MRGGGGAGAGTAAPALGRHLGLLDAVGIGVGAIVGAGIFVVIGIAADVAGPALLVALLLAAVAATANALSSAQLAAEYPQAGGTYEYGHRVLGAWPGFVAGWMFLASKTAAAGTVALGLAGYLDPLLPGVAPRAVAVVAIALFTALNALGVRRSSQANLAIVALSVGALLLLVVAGLPAVDARNLRPFAPAGVRGTLEAAALLFFAYTGYARVATLAEEVREPRRTIPRAIAITIGGAVLLYAAVALVAVGSVGAPALAATSAPLRAAALGVAPPWVATAVTVGGVTAMLGVVLSQLLGLSRMLFAMARRGDLPGALARVHPVREVPVRAVLLVGAVAAVVAATGTLRAVASAASFAILVYYGIANACALRMPRAARRYPAVVAWTGLVACLVLLLSLDPRTIAVGVATLLAGVAWRTAFVRARRGA